MQRLRMSIPYFKELGYESEVVTVDENYIDVKMDKLLLQSVPADVKIHKVKALSKKWTSKFGLGSLALRSLWYYRQKVNKLLASKNFDLIYFSTTQFPVCILGAYWKKKFKVPYVIDMQDPWHSEYYQNKNADERPKKYWFSYRLNKYLEPIAMKSVDGLVSVSAKYIQDLKFRYPVIKGIPELTLPFSSFSVDFDIARQNQQKFKKLLNDQYFNIVYVGRGGKDMHRAIDPVFSAFKAFTSLNSEAGKFIKFHFIGTSYASGGEGEATIMPLARKYGLEHNVIEITDRIGFYHTLVTLLQADALFIPGSDDPGYIASKLYPYLLSNKPLLAVFNPQSPAIDVLHEFDLDTAYDFESVTSIDLIPFFEKLLAKTLTTSVYNERAIIKYSAREMAKQQIAFFNLIINGNH